MAEPADAPPRLPHLPADIFMEILSRVGGVVAVVRCAATCKAWRRLILEPSFLSRHRVGSSSLLGFFFRDTSQKRAHRRRYLRRPTRFLLLHSSQPQATTELHMSQFLPNAAGLSRFNAVVASGAGRLALGRAKGSSGEPIRICVCDPMAGTSTFLPPLPTSTTLFRESLVFLDADGSSFRLVAAVEMNWTGKILLRVFSSRTGQWGAALTAQPPDNLVVLFGSPAVVHHGAVHWICETRAHPYTVHALAVRLGQTEVSMRRVDLPLQAGINRHNTKPLRLSSSAHQGCLSLVLLDKSVISIWNFQDDGTAGKSWALHKTVYLMPDPFAPWWSPSIAALCDQSGSLFLTAGQGLFMVNLETGMTSKVCDARCDKYECPYMPDLRSCLGAMKSF
ncbi:uncharacterized protein LOC124655722 [Lolium rigidum]|uniref:uncharacterized protein LOC124655722 n=1 Tax=Lolium rigidum TaxID=89674 RepID=UPI001F5D1D81|nr:uncharacterized protein LOC124655722 [Lolium rigidum]